MKQLIFCLVPALFSQGILDAEEANIVVMLSDDMGCGQVGCQGESAIPTPNIDRLAGEGASLTQFYGQPVCTSPRSAFLTGRNPFRTGTETRVSGNDIAGMLLDGRRADACRFDPKDQCESSCPENTQRQ